MTDANAIPNGIVGASAVTAFFLFIAVLDTETVGHHPPGVIWSLFMREKFKLSNIFYVKETVQVVPENTYKTHHVNPSSVTSVSSVGTMVMFLLLD